MTKQKTPPSFYSPFTHSSFSDGKNRSLLVQFFLDALFQSLDCSCSYEKPLFPPYDWAMKISPWEKLREHSSLLDYAFPQLKEHTALIKIALGENPKNIFALFLPFVETCKKDAHFLFYLLRHQKEIDQIYAPETLKSLLNHLFPNGGINSVGSLISDNFQKRGFSSLIPEVNSLIEKNHAE